MAIEGIKESIASVVEEYFEMDSVTEERIEDYKEFIEELRSVLSSLKKKK